MAGLLKKIFDSGYKEMKRLEKIADKVVELENDMRQMTDEQLQNKTEEFRNRLNNGETLDDILVEAFAVVRESATRVLHMTPFYVQIIGALVIHYGNVAEMKTGEGKTLTSTMPAYLNGLKGEGVHIVTVNEYLATRDAHDMGILLNWLGLSVGLNINSMTKEEKREAFNCDVTYTTNNELGFDYLRDNMIIYKKDMVLKPLNFAIIDEVDSILIDEARTPLIISGGKKRNANLYRQANMFVNSLTSEDYDHDIKTRNVQLSELGIEKAERSFSITNLFDVQHAVLVHHINNALKANVVMQNNIDYVVQEGEVVIVDPFTGRLMQGRQWSEGLHQAVEAKEGVKIKEETATLATITFQNFFRMYNKLSGMTGTAKTEEEEFINIYNMYVVEVPTNEPVIRDDANDFIFASMDAKFKAITSEVTERHQKGQPLLIGTVAVETSELISNYLRKKGIKHNVLNAKNHEREAEIILQAGHKGAVTIATNMAGRGTDIKLGEGVIELGGLAVIGTERHESRRIDNQLRGRSGRQGDPGYSRFYLSLQDDLLRRFGSERLQGTLGRLGLKDDQAIEHKLISRSVESAQKRVEGNNFDSRKTLLQYDEVIGQQREIIYGQRYQILTLDDIKPIVENMFRDAVDNIVTRYVMFDNPKDVEAKKEGINNLINYFNTNIFGPNAIKLNEIKDLNKIQLIEFFDKKALCKLNEKEEIFEPEVFHEFLKVIVLRIVDMKWMDHIDMMDGLRQSIGLVAYGQNNPLIQYQQEGFELFTNMVSSINEDILKYIIRAQVQDNLQREEVAKPVAAKSGKEDTAAKKQPVRKQKIGRNDPCPCGSGKKYKQCCGA